MSTSSPWTSVLIDTMSLTITPQRIARGHRDGADLCMPADTSTTLNYRSCSNQSTQPPLQNAVAPRFVRWDTVHTPQERGTVGSNRNSVLLGSLRLSTLLLFSSDTISLMVSPSGLKHH